MGLCSYSTESVTSNQTSVDNIFFTNYLPYASEICVKVYMYGLYKCNNSFSYDNTIEAMAKTLNISEDDLYSCFLYWQEQGLVQILHTIPYEVRYLPITNNITHIKKYKQDKYADFILQVQEIIKGRMITPNEFNDYFSLIETLHFEPSALVMLIQRCVSFKGENVGSAYILSVAKNWAYEKILTCQAVEERLKELDRATSDANEIFKIFGIKRKPTIEETQAYDKWIKKLDYDLGTIKYVATLMKKSKQTTFEKLDEKLMSLYEMKLLTIKDIDAFQAKKDELYGTAKLVCKNIGVYYENLEPVIETYIAKWIEMGYEEQTLVTLANYAFKSSIRTLEGLNTVINKFFKLGIVTKESIEEYLNQTLAKDAEIKEILNQMGIARNVNQFDRELYKTWTEEWQINNELLSYGASCSSQKSQPMQYLNKLLSSWHTNKITKIEDAQKYSMPTSQTKKIVQGEKREYTDKEISTMFTSLKEIDL